ncbi:hypothetical protein [Tengunoibacter tsumagoiensis]|uniref:PKD domain-containing protein n=1 Tax=Tengunoibacter tsumagoiensis TaxID=2014871 RepID=A0A401ZUS6_9CHLR|nr:hypothetical protein [Tengunoibacter tsumagoiensis]GCE10480.1 hypothetical protein KTT_03390 [Tengunoibacter tsumagoiensis]
MREIISSGRRLLTRVGLILLLAILLGSLHSVASTSAQADASGLVSQNYLGLVCVPYIGTVATLDAATASQLHHASVKIDWGSGHVDTHASLTFQADGSAVVNVQHTYMSTGSMTFTVYVDGFGSHGLHLSSYAIATIVDPYNYNNTIKMKGYTLQPAKRPGQFTLNASLLDPEAATLSDLKAVINWGDGHFTAGALSNGDNGLYLVHASHRYLLTGKYTVLLIIYDQNENSVILPRNVRT